MNKYLDFCNRYMQGKVGYRKGFYILDKVETPINKQMADAVVDISVVTPTQVAVEQAKSELEQEKTINKAKKRKYNQSGGSIKRVKKKDKKKSKIKKQKKIPKRKVIKKKL